MARHQELLLRAPMLERGPHCIERVIASIVIAVATALVMDAVPSAHADGTWLEVPTSGSLPPGNGYSAIYDPTNRRKILFAGNEIPNVLSPTSRVWTLDLETGVWTEPMPAGAMPAARNSPVSIYDPVRQRMVTFGGGYNFTLNDTWELLLPPGGALTWQKVATKGPPDPRSAPVAVYDPVRDRMLLFGGLTGSNTVSNEIWSLDFTTNTWQLISPVGTAPAPRSEAAGIYDPNADRLLIFGGTEVSGVEFFDTWQLSLSGTPEWTQLSVSGLPSGGIEWRQAVLDPVRNRMLLLPRAFEVWSLNLGGPPAWSQLVVDGTPGGYAGPVYDPVEDRVLVERNRGGLVIPIPHATWALQFDRPTPVSMALARVEVILGRVELAWRGAGGAFQSAHVERREQSTGWRQLASLVPDATGEIRFEDGNVRGGSRYAYRLVYSTRGGEQTTPETWVDVPAQAILSLERRNPGSDLDVAFSLPTSDPASIEVYDVGGRRLVTHEVGSSGAGTHRLKLASGIRLPAGVYSLRLIQGAHIVVTRAVVVP